MPPKKTPSKGLGSKASLAAFVESTFQELLKLNNEQGPAKAPPKKNTGAANKKSKVQKTTLKPPAQAKKQPRAPEDDDDAEDEEEDDEDDDGAATKPEAHPVKAVAPRGGRIKDTPKQPTPKQPTPKAPGATPRSKGQAQQSSKSTVGAASSHAADDGGPSKSALPVPKVKISWGRQTNSKVKSN